MVLLPSGASHFPVIVPPTPLENGVTTVSSGLLSLKGNPKNPQTTGAFTVSDAVGEAWMWAATKLSFESGVCDPVKSRLETVTDMVMAVMASFSTKVAVPNEAGRGAPVVVVGVVGGFSCAFVRFATSMVAAWQ